MLFINPRQVRFGDRVWGDASAVVIDRAAARLVESWSDHGPFGTLVDVAEERVTVKVVQSVAGDAPGTLALGEEAELSFVSTPTGTDQGAREVRATCVIVGVAHELSAKSGAVRTITLRAVSDDGSADPVAVVDVVGTGAAGGGGLGVGIEI